MNVVTLGFKTPFNLAMCVTTPEIPSEWLTRPMLWFSRLPRRDQLSYIRRGWLEMGPFAEHFDDEGVAFYVERRLLSDEILGFWNRYHYYTPTTSQKAEAVAAFIFDLNTIQGIAVSVWLPK